MSELTTMTAVESNIIDPGRVYTPAQISDFAQCSQEHVAACAASGSLTAFRLGRGMLRILGRAAIEWIEKGGHQAKTPVVKRIPTPPPIAPAMRALIAKYTFSLRDPQCGYIYFIQCSRFVKVGFSQNVDQRFQDLQAACPYELKLLGKVRGPMFAERDLHILLSPYHHRREWFRLVPRLSSAIKELCNGPDA